ncbi:hypothetical protein FS749_003163 [Ceratobasidium sp. UAMH 11750]|nr:hypothetical protein FS749_003163 [Ceratobasidium sp. UAMH 11750]
MTLLGESAGTTSVGYHLLRERETTAIMDSGGPTARAFPKWTYPFYQTQMEEFRNLTGCAKGADSAARFACLRSLQADTVKNASVTFYNKYNAILVAHAAHLSWEAGNFNKVPILTGFNCDEGTIFVPQNLIITTELNAFFRTLAPTISDSQLATVDNLYLGALDVARSPYANSPSSPQFLGVAAAYSDFA